MKKLLENKYAIPVIALLIGIAVGSIFYPSKTITREETAKYEAKIEKLETQKREIKKEMENTVDVITELNHIRIAEKEQRITSLRTENTNLRQKTKERIIKIIKPDGTITEEIVRESDTEIVSQIVTDIKQEFNEKVTSIENKWKTIHKKRVIVIKEKYEKKLTEKQHIIDTYSKKETIKINERKFGVSLGYTSDDNYFSNISYDIYGPFFLDFHIESNEGFSNTNTGIGIGIRF